MEGREGKSTRGKRLRSVTIFLVYVYVAGIVMFCFVLRGGLSSLNFRDDSYMSYTKMINWTAEWPYVYRTLLPSLVKFVGALTPTAVKQRVNSYAENKPFLKKIGWTTRYSYECLVSLGFIFVVWIAFAYSVRHLVQMVYVTDPAVSDMAPVAALLLVPAFFLENWTAIYDPMVVLMGSLGPLLILKREHKWYYVFFPLAVLNKVTAVIFTCAFAAREFRYMSGVRLGAHIAAQIMIWAGLMALLGFLFKDNPGTKAHFQLFWNLGGFVLSVSLLHTLYSLAFFAGFAFLIGYQWKKKPKVLRQVFLAMALLFIPAVMMFGRAMDELRVWYDLYPAAFLVALPSICSILQIEMTSRPEFDG
ncbi:MAG: hypothetical protein RDU20_07155 [Desulfomonilaceae bacterium]|nr:hypothetical protein [Desulfomonilaceae bacterium]